MKRYLKNILIGYTLFLLIVNSFAIANGKIAPESFYSLLNSQKLVNQDGNTIDYGLLQNNLVLVNFIFTHCPEVCPSQNIKLKSLYKSLSSEIQKKVRFLSISVDPDRDTTKKLKQYAKKLDLDTDYWTFATGSNTHIEQLKKQLLLMNPNIMNPTPDDHQTAVWLLDNNGKIMQRYRGNPLNIKRIKQELGSLYKLTISKN